MRCNYIEVIKKKSKRMNLYGDSVSHLQKMDRHLGS